MTKTRGATPIGPRASLIVRMSNAAHGTGVVPRRIHLVVAIDRLLVRLLQAAPGQWVVKGGDPSLARLGRLDLPSSATGSESRVDHSAIRASSS
jgi:hypothetical protein